MDNRMTLPIGNPLMFFLILIVPLFILMLFINAIKASFLSLGFSPLAATMLVLISIIGSIINFPIKDIVTKKLVLESPKSIYYSILYPQSSSPLYTKKTTRISLNLGGAIVPLFVCGYLFVRYPEYIFPWSLVTIPVAIGICYKVARVLPNVGIVMPTFIPPFTAASLALVFQWGNIGAIPLSYVTGVIGVIIGADLMNINKLSSTAAPMASIGGAGTFDGIFLTGVVSVFLGEVISFL